MLTGTAQYTSDLSHWAGSMMVLAPEIRTNDSHYDKDLSLTKSGAIDNHSAGGNWIGGNLKWSNRGSNQFLSGELRPDSILGNLSMVSMGDNAKTALSYSSIDNFIRGDVAVTITHGGIEASLAYCFNASLEILGTTSCNSL